MSTDQQHNILHVKVLLTHSCAGRPSLCVQVARVWDALFLEGSKILFRTALAVLKAQEEALLQIDNAGG